MPILKNVDEVKREFHNRATLIQKALVGDTLKTKEDVRQLLNNCKKSLSVQQPFNGVKNVPIDTFKVGPASSAYNALVKQINLLNAQIGKLPNLADYQEAQRQTQENEDLEKDIRGKIDQFFIDVSELDDSNAYKSETQNLKDKFDAIIKKYCEDRPFTKAALPEMIKEITDVVKESEPKFEPKLWHSIADLALTFLNSLKLILRVDYHFKLFSEKRKDVEEVNSKIEELKEFVESVDSPSVEPTSAATL